MPWNILMMALLHKTQATLAGLPMDKWYMPLTRRLSIQKLAIFLWLKHRSVTILLKPTGKKEEVKKVKVATINRGFIESNETYQKDFSLASKLASENKTLEAFNDPVTENGLTKKTANNLQVMSNFISGLQNPRQIIHWAFNEDTEVGDVSPVFDLEGMFVVAALKSKT